MMMKNRAAPEILLSQKMVYESRAFEVYEREVKKLNGDVLTRAIIMEDEAVMIVPIFKNGEVQLISEYRAASQCWVLQLPAGGIEEGETPMEAAKRELAEEAGLSAGKMVKIGNCYSSPGVTTEYLHIFLATELTPTTTGKLDVDEHIEPITWSFSKCIEGVVNQQIVDAKSITGLMQAALFTGMVSIKNEEA